MTFWEQAGITKLEDQLHYMSRQADLLDEQGHDVSAQVMRECMKLLATKSRELEQQTRFKYEANKRADALALALFEVVDSAASLDKPWDLQGYGIEAKRAEQICELAALGKPVT